MRMGRSRRGDRKGKRGAHHGDMGAEAAVEAGAIDADGDTEVELGPARGVLAALEAGLGEGERGGRRRGEASETGAEESI